MSLVQIGSLAFGLVIGWYAYSVIRNRSDTVALGDLATMIGAVGGGAVLALFPAGSDLFACYGIGLSVGFFGYLLVLLVLIRKNSGRGWTTAFFLDGRRPPLAAGQDRANVPGMGESERGSDQRPPQIPR
jgi:uncharacterized membrane protein YeaQ/YmgE (transglycosylase-associated protein family)